MSREVNQEELGRFRAELEAKLEHGAREYGPGSYERSAAELLGELKSEALDLAGWGFILWAKIDRMERQVGKAG